MRELEGCLFVIKRNLKIAIKTTQRDRY